MQTLDPVAGLVKGVDAMIVSCEKHSVLIRLRNGTSWRVPRTTHKYRPSHFRDSVEIDRHQLPLAVNFASTVHRVQGDTLDRVLVDLRSPMFAHGQLYTAVTRVRVRKNIFFLVPPTDFFPAAGCTPAHFVCRNIVFTSILRYCPAVRHALHAVFLASDAFQASSANPIPSPHCLCRGNRSTSVAALSRVPSPTMLCGGMRVCYGEARCRAHVTAALPIHEYMEYGVA